MFIGHAYTMHTLYFDFPPSKCIFYDILKSKELDVIPKSNWVNAAWLWDKHVVYMLLAKFIHTI